MRRVVLPFGAMLLIAIPALSQTPASDAPLEEVVVTGEFPGLAWQVRRADDAAGHVCGSWATRHHCRSA
jgi:hypothetical protein